MKLTKTICAVLALTIIMSCCLTVCIINPASAAQTDTAPLASAYSEMLEQIKAENKYGLADTVNEGTILQAWNWSFANISANLETVAQQGFTTIQVSPPNEIKAATKGINVFMPGQDTDSATNGWWMFYQPAGFQLNQSTDNALGTKSEFIAMCQKAHSLGVKVIVDAVINHMGTNEGEGANASENNAKKYNTSTDPMTHLTKKASLFEQEIVNAKAFHEWHNCEYHETSNFSVSEVTRSLTRDSTSKLPDLNTASTVVQTAIYDYLKELVEAGADGFRIDAAKHIETPNDVSPYGSQFWNNTLEKIRKDFPQNEGFAYGEILNTCGYGRSFSSYTKYMDVTDSASYWDIANAVRGYGGNAIPYYPNSNFTKANCILWNESHDTYADKSTVAMNTQQLQKIWALEAARSGITCVYFARPSDQTNLNPLYSIQLGAANKTGWSTAPVRVVNQFNNFFGSEGEYNTVENGVAMLERGNTGVMLVNLSGTTKSVSMTTHTLSDGKYTDAATGTTFTVSGKRLTGQIGSSGIAALYYSGDDTPVKPTGVVEPTVVGDVYPTQPGCYTVVFSNSKFWQGSINLYCWATGSDGAVAWPGAAMSKIKTNEFGEDQYIAFVPTDTPNVIINNGTVQTADIALTGHTGLYASSDASPTTFGTWDIAVESDPTDPPITIAQPTEIGPTTVKPTNPPIPTTTLSQTDPTKPTVPTGYSYQLGDSDEDGVINIKDSTNIQKVIADLPIKNYSFDASDVNENKYLDIGDASAIQKYLVKLESGTNCGNYYK